MSGVITLAVPVRVQYQEHQIVLNFKTRQPKEVASQVAKHYKERTGKPVVFAKKITPPFREETVVVTLETEEQQEE